MFCFVAVALSVLVVDIVAEPQGRLNDRNQKKLIRLKNLCQI